MYVRRKGCNDYTLIRTLVKKAFKGRTDRLFAHGKAGTFGIRTVRHKGENALVAEFAYTCKVNHFAVNRGRVNFKVACVQNYARRGVQSNRNGIGYRMVCVNEFGFDTAEAHRVARLDIMQLCRMQYPVFL